ncbi:CoA pyrophosphatase [Chloracidobacterium validum]|uniref:CoA pyrophosphatase n=1 Tax=Chloracidobacterium validum TaxID=2821543 RepID=A0ABX8B5W7_9BACT|nr:CoA pyrophosphatase [Chloracidobacterium validum]QUW02364.1 CoA pyrophosphatase [Chloracidobacterium validum]
MTINLQIDRSVAGPAGPDAQRYTVSVEFTRRAAQVLRRWDAGYAPANGDDAQAAVLVPLFFKHGMPHLLLTKRASHLRRHRGEVAFPGGRRDPHDTSPVMTALREAHEEIGLPAEQVLVIGLLDPFETNTGFQITPVVGIIPYPIAFQLDHSETECLIEVPLPVIARTEARETRQFLVNNRLRSVYFFHYAERDPIWGASGYIVQRFLDVVYPLVIADLAGEAVL